MPNKIGLNEKRHSMDLVKVAAEKPAVTLDISINLTFSLHLHFSAITRAASGDYKIITCPTYDNCHGNGERQGLESKQGFSVSQNQFKATHGATLMS